MSNRRAVFSALIVTALAGSPAARAQTQELLDHIRAGEPGVAAEARGELEACVKRRCPRAPELRLLAGLLQLSAGDAAEAAATLRGGRPPRGMEAFGAWYLGEAQAWSGQRAQAVRTLEGAATAAAPPWLRRRATRRRAELLLDLGQAARARPALEHAAEADPGPETLLTRALARAGTGDLAQALRDFRTIALRFPRHPHAALALARLEARGAAPAWSPEELLERAQAFLAAGEGVGALAALDALPAPSPRALLTRGQALLLLRRDAAAVEALEAAAGTADPGVASEAALALARRWLRLDRTPEARAAFQRVEAGWPAQAAADEAGYLAAWLAMNQGQLAEAVSAFEAFERRHPGSRRRDEARWFRAFSLLRGGQAGAAREVLESLPSDFPGSPLVPQALYWQARLAASGPAGPDSGGAPDAGEPTTAGRYRALAQGYPQSLYARLALEQLRRLGEPAPEPFAPLEAGSPRPPAPELALAARLAGAGLFRDAREEVEASVARVQGAADALRLGAALQALGEYAAAHALASRHLWTAAFTARDPRALELLYPRAWRGQVDRWARAQGVEPAFAWAIMKRESAFRPDATSLADARGLMQLVPSTARQIALDAHLAPPEPEALYGPELSVRFGTWYLGRLFHRLGHPALVAAAYNGGPAPVLRWLQARGEEPLDLWIEGIPYRETRAYVKQVLADASIYQALYGGEAAPLTLALPRPGPGGIAY